jgi:hypothetical protein
MTDWDKLTAAERRPGTAHWGKRTAGMSDDEKSRLLFRLSKAQEQYEFEMELPGLTRIKHQKRYVGKGKDYTYNCPRLYWDRKSWWRFKRCAYGQGYTAAGLIRRLLTDAIVAYEETLDRGQDGSPASD